MGNDRVEGNYESIILDLLERVKRLEVAPLTAHSLSDITPDLGIVEAGEIRVHADPLNPKEPGDGFSGVRIVDRFEYPEGSGQYYAIVGASNDSPTFLISAIDGTGKFANLHATLGANGIDIDDFLAYAIRHTFTNDGKERVGKLGPDVISGSTTPVWAMIYTTPAAAEIMVQGGFELGDFTNWTKTTEINGAWAIDNVVYHAGAYSAKWIPTADGDGNSKILMHFDGVDASTTITDVSGKTWTAYNGAQLDTAQKVFGTASLLLDGTNDYIDTPDHADFDLDNDDFEFEFRFRPHATKFQCVFSQCIAAGTSLTIEFDLVADGSFAVYYQSTVGAMESFGCTPAEWTYSLDTWYTGSVSRYGNTLYVRIDGVTIKTKDVTGITIKTSASKFAIGRPGELNAAYFNGWIDEFLFVKGVARHTADYTPATAAYGAIITQGILTSDAVTVTVSTAYFISAWIRGTVLAGTIKAEINWYSDAGATTLISTDLIGNLLGAGDFELKENVFTSPATAIRAKVVLTCLSSTTSLINFDDISISLSTVNQKLWLSDDGANCSNGLYPQSAILLCEQGIMTGGTTKFVLATQRYCSYAFPTTTTINNQALYTCTLQKGTYNLELLYLKSNDGGQIDIFVDNVEVVSNIEMYNSPNVLNQVSLTTGISVTYNGLHTIKLIAPSKHASSSAYKIFQSAIAMVRTGA